MLYFKAMSQALTAMAPLTSNGYSPIHLNYETVAVLSVPLEAGSIFAIRLWECAIKEDSKKYVVE
jgi:hypothetical protein